MTKFELLKKVKLKMEKAYLRYQHGWPCGQWNRQMDYYHFWRRVYKRLKADIAQAQELRG